jgi:hypothetical protein
MFKVIILIPKYRFPGVLLDSRVSDASLKGIIDIILLDISKNSASVVREAVTGELFEWVRRGIHIQCQSLADEDLRQTVDSFSKLCTILDRPDITATTLATLLSSSMLSAPLLTDCSLRVILKQTLSRAKINKNIDEIWEP